jgi:hypothetical protein
MNLHAQLAEAAVEQFGERLTASPVLSQDALTLMLDTGTTLQVRFANAGEYSLRWRHGDAELGIDTAPLHAGLATFPNHLHVADGEVRADPVTRPGRAPWDNLQALLVMLLDGRPPG